ncbi:MAG TPA: DUF4037 domain-containing protein [Caldilineaceae bacterium]|nr:DUF4037 domain-containing protein [Caldilineaceae bacterium]
MEEAAIKGLAIAKDFFLHWGKPFLEQEFPALTGRIAVGRFSGSDVLGADDAISRDHNWGPQFTLFLSENDFSRYGAQLSATMNQAAPTKWLDYWVDGAGDKNVHVESVPLWIEEAIGFAAAPQTDADWGVVVRHRSVGGTIEARESALYYLKHGALWLNNNAQFAEWRTALAYYPEHVWYARLAEECFRLWQYGEYNFVERVAKRGDPIAIRTCLGEFARGVMRITLLLQKDFTPYWKWLTYAFRKCDRASHYAPLLESLLGSAEPAQQATLVKHISHDIHQELVSMGIITQDEKWTKHYLLLVNAQSELMAKAPWMTPSWI